MIGPDQPPALDSDPDLAAARRQEESASREQDFQLAMACLLTAPVMNEVERRPRKKDRVKRLKRKRKNKLKAKRKKEDNQQTKARKEPNSTERTNR